MVHGAWRGAIESIPHDACNVLQASPSGAALGGSGNATKGAWWCELTLTAGGASSGSGSGGLGRGRAAGGTRARTTRGRRAALRPAWLSIDAWVGWPGPVLLPQHST